MSTPHIAAKKDEIAKTVFMAGDPKRVKFFVENYMNDYKLVSDIRNIVAYTGTINNKKITVMAHGMGMDSIGIYAYELYKFYDVENIIRFGSTGAYDPNFNLFDFIIAEKAFTESNYGIGFGYDKEIIEGDKYLIDLAKETVVENGDEGITHSVTVNSSMWFYAETPLKNINEYVEKGIPVVEMEAYALYVIAKRLNKRALTVLTVSDNIAKSQETTPEQREKSFTTMFNCIIGLSKKINK